MRIYISGPITGHEEDYIERFAQAEQDLMKEYPEAELINPAKIMEHMADHAKVTHQEYMNVSLTLLEMCTHIYLMDGWMDSVGCCIEIDYALDTDKEIICNPDDLKP